MQSRLTEIDKSHFCAIIRMGCDRDTACMRLGISPVQLRLEATLDGQFERSIVQNAAEIELEHMRNLRKASEDPKNWRISQWWLERRAPQRYAARAVGALSSEQLDELFSRLASIIRDEAPQSDAVTRIIERFEHARQRVEASLVQSAALPLESDGHADDPGAHPGEDSHAA